MNDDNAPLVRFHSDFLLMEREEQETILETMLDDIQRRKSMNGENKDGEEQDLNWHKQEESDNLQKSEKPDSDYMKSLNLCSLCQGNKRVCDQTGCPQKVSI